MEFRTYYYLRNTPENKKDLFNDLVEKRRNLNLDEIGLIQFIKFHYPLYDRTFIKEIKSGYCWDNGERLNYKYNEKRKGYDKKNEKLLWEIINHSLKEICSDQKKIYGAGNSGGLDSRTILYILKNLKVDFRSYTFGNKSSDAVHIANKTAKILGFPNKNIDIEPDFLQKYYDTILEKNPMFSLLYSWYYSVHRDLPYFDINITGFNGDNMLGSHLSKKLLEFNSKSQLYEYIYNHYAYVSDNLLKQIVKDKSLIKRAHEDFLENIAKSENLRNENIFEEFNFKCRQLKFIKKSINFDFCGSYKWKSPFCSKNFIDFALNLTFEERFKRKLYYNMGRKHMIEVNSLRFERSYLSLKDRNRIKILFKRIIWGLDNKFKLKFYYKGSHKTLTNWLKEGNSFDFIKRQFELPSRIFEEIFDLNYIKRNLGSIFKKNEHLIFNILTIKMWIDTIYVNIQ